MLYLLSVYTHICVYMYEYTYIYIQLVSIPFYWDKEIKI